MEPEALQNTLAIHELQILLCWREGMCIRSRQAMRRGKSNIRLALFRRNDGNSSNF